MIFDDSPTISAAQVEAALERIRPALVSDGGNIELVAIETNGDIRVRLKGACVGCPSSTITLKHLVERILREEVAGFGDLITE
ncbi:MAG TPA: NifU family protein [Blastocatellia bacterium]|nr:NifU family protein [Blastocatellia bacterium]